MCTALLAGCSIKEDREECPRYVSVDMSGADIETLLGSGCEQLHLGLVPMGECKAESAASVSLPLEDLPGSYEFEAPREGLRLWGVCSAGGDYCGSGGFVISAGMQCPPVYAWRMELPPGGDDEVPLSLHKEFCRLDIYFKEGFMSGCEYRITGNSCGVDEDGSPLEGGFECALSPDESGLCRVRVPRQADGSLRLRITGGEEEVRVFAIGEYILRSGYDWRAADLGDVTVTVSFTSTSATFIIDLWQKTRYIDVAF